jgi:hypothetical protein
MFVGMTRVVRLPGPNERAAIVSQPGMLGLLHELCSEHAGFRIDGRALDEALLGRIQNERQPEIDEVQARQTRAGRMVLKQCRGT